MLRPQWRSPTVHEQIVNHVCRRCSDFREGTCERARKRTANTVYPGDKTLKDLSTTLTARELFTNNSDRRRRGIYRFLRFRSNYTPRETIYVLNQVILTLEPPTIKICHSWQRMKLKNEKEEIRVTRQRATLYPYNLPKSYIYKSPETYHLKYND